MWLGFTSSCFDPVAFVTLLEVEAADAAELVEGSHGPGGHDLELEIWSWSGHGFCLSASSSWGCGSWDWDCSTLKHNCNNYWYILRRGKDQDWKIIKIGLKNTKSGIYVEEENSTSTLGLICIWLAVNSTSPCVFYLWDYLKHL